MDQLVNLELINISELDSESVFQSPFWAYVKSPLWKAYAFKYKTMYYEGTFLILVRKLFYSFSIAYSPFCFKKMEYELLIEISKKIKSLINEKLLLVRYDFDYKINNINFLKPLHECKYSIQPTSSVLIDLTKDLEFKKRVKRNLKKESLINISKWNNNDEEFESWYSTYLETSKRDGFDARSKIYIKKLLSYQGIDVKPILYLAKKDDQVVGGILNIRNNYEEIYLFGSSLFISDGISCGYSLQNYAINKAKEEGIKIYDLFGIGEGNLYKLTTFKTSFGGDVVNRLSSCDYYFHKGLSTIYKLIENIRFYLKRG